MVKKSGLRRIKGGKTLKIDLELESDIIKDIIISGDFFAYPAEAIEELENTLKGTSIHDLRNIIIEFRKRVTLVGISFKDIIELLDDLINS